MNWLFTWIKTFGRYFYLYSFTDIIEILFFSSLFYYVSLWLRKDDQKPLIYTFYGYCTLTLGAYYFNLTTMTHVFFLSAPVIMISFIILHQKTLQKNFITLHNIVPSHAISHDWISTLTRISLHAMNNETSLNWLIEKEHHLANFLQSPFILNTQLQDTLVSTLITSKDFNEASFIWLKYTGTLMSVNTTWKEQEQEFWVHPDVKKFDQWKHDAALFTKKTDAIVVHSSAKSQSFTIIAQGTCLDHIKADKVITILQAYTSKQKHNESNKKPKISGAYKNETNDKTTTQQQRH